MNPAKMRLQDKFRSEIHETINRLQKEIERQDKINVINYQIPIIHQTKPLVNLKLGVLTFKSLLDTGADTNLLPGHIYEQLRRDNIVPEMTPVRLGHQIRGVTGDTLNVAGYCQLTFTLDDSGIRCTEEFLVIYERESEEQNRLKIIIGYPAMRRHRLVILPGKGVIREQDLLRQVSNLEGIYPVVAEQDQLLIPGLDSIVQGRMLNKAGQTQDEQVGQVFAISADLDPELGQPRPLFIPFIWSCSPARVVHLRINPDNIGVETLIRKDQVIAYGIRLNLWTLWLKD